MSWVERFKGSPGRGVARRLTVYFLAAISSFITLARAAATGLIDPLDTRVHPMYGVPYDPGPVVKYGPPPTFSPVPTYSGVQPPTDWNSIWTPPWDLARQPVQFTPPDFGHWFPSFPKMFNIVTSDFLTVIGIAAYVTLMLWAVCGWTVWGGVWYMKNKGKK
jgi:hypothetical protein